MKKPQLDANNGYESNGPFWMWAVVGGAWIGWILFFIWIANE